MFCKSVIAAVIVFEEKLDILSGEKCFVLLVILSLSTNILVRQRFLRLLYMYIRVARFFLVQNTKTGRGDTINYHKITN
jgi:hypothetical protein